jgi:hypothetical protein
MDMYWEEIKPYLTQMGFSIDDDFLDKISKRDYKYITEQIKEMPKFIIEEVKSLLYENQKKIVIKYCSNNESIKKVYKIEYFISRGSYNETFIITDLHTEKQFVFRKAISKCLNNNLLINNFIESFIHSFLTIYQSKFLASYFKGGLNKYIIRMHLIGVQPDINYISSLTDRMEGTVYDLLATNKINIDTKIKLILKMFVQVISFLEDLQEKFKFVHNDLKINNIFCKRVDDNSIDFNFYIGDFDGSRLEINNILIAGNPALYLDTSFNSRKDLCLLIHSIYFSYNNEEWFNKFFKHFALKLNIITDTKNFHKIYFVPYNEIPEMYEIKNFKELLSKNFGVVF